MFKPPICGPLLRQPGQAHRALKPRWGLKTPAGGRGPGEGSQGKALHAHQRLPERVIPGCWQPRLQHESCTGPQHPRSGSRCRARDPQVAVQWAVSCRGPREVVRVACMCLFRNRKISHANPDFCLSQKRLNTRVCLLMTESAGGQQNRGHLPLRGHSPHEPAALRLGGQPEMAPRAHICTLGRGMP